MRRLPIPGDLRDALREVWARIQDARRDPDINLDYDDAIQIGPLCGGRCGSRRRPFQLRYRPAGDPVRGHWFLTFDPTEIEDIVDGRITDNRMHCCTGPDCRYKFREASELCPNCDFEPDPAYAHLPTAEGIPRLERLGIGGLTSESTRADVVATLGEPQEAGGGTSDPTFGYTNPWVKYHRPDGQIRFEFGRRGSIDTITFMPPDWRPGQ